MRKSRSLSVVLSMELFDVDGRRIEWNKRSSVQINVIFLKLHTQKSAHMNGWKRECQRREYERWKERQRLKEIKPWTVHWNYGWKSQEWQKKITVVLTQFQKYSSFSRVLILIVWTCNILSVRWEYQLRKNILKILFLNKLDLYNIFELFWLYKLEKIRST